MATSSAEVKMIDEATVQDPSQQVCVVCTVCKKRNCSLELEYFIPYKVRM